MPKVSSAGFDEKESLLPGEHSTNNSQEKILQIIKQQPVMKKISSFLKIDERLKLRSTCNSFQENLLLFPHPFFLFSDDLQKTPLSEREAIKKSLEEDLKILNKRKEAFDLNFEIHPTFCVPAYCQQNANKSSFTGTCCFPFPHTAENNNLLKWKCSAFWNEFFCFTFRVEKHGRVGDWVAGKLLQCCVFDFNAIVMPICIGRPELALTCIGSHMITNYCHTYSTFKDIDKKVASIKKHQSFWRIYNPIQLNYLMLTNEQKDESKIMRMER